MSRIAPLLILVTTAALPAQAAPPKTTMAFDPVALLRGASSDVPDAALKEYPAIFGGSLTRHTAITGLEFHIPGVVSSQAMSRTPIPIVLEDNGVEYYQVTGELSARIVDDLGIYRVIGPIDAQGVNHRGEAFDPYEPTVVPGDHASHPRAGLPGAFFTIRWPVSGFNGRIVHNQACNDGGSDYVQAPYAWQNIDDIVLLHEGYAIVSVGVGGTVYARKNADGTETIDSNPESGSGIFWTEDGLCTGCGIWETEHSRIVPNTRAAGVDAAFHETALDAHAAVNLWVPDDDGIWITDDGITNPYFDWAIAQGVAPELIRDATVVFKNLLTQATGERDLWTVYVGWSGSGNPAWQLVTGKQSNALVLTTRAHGSPPNAGNFNRWRDPASGRRFDAFVVYAGALPWPWFSDDNDFDFAAHTLDADPEYPMQAPYVFLQGSGDVLLGTINPYIQTNGVARAWPTSRMASQSMDRYISVLYLDKAAHGARDQLISNYDRGPFTGATWWDPSLADAPESLNEEHRGYRNTSEYARMAMQNGDDLGGFTWYFHGMLRTTPLYLALFDRMSAGKPLPTSRVNPLVFDHLDAIDESTPFPPIAHPCDTTRDSAWEDHMACVAGLTGDATAWVDPLSPTELAAVRYFGKQNPLSRSTAPLLLPDAAAPRGYYYFLWATQLVRPFTDAELAARYGSHDGYVAAFSAATEALIAQGLWDKQLGEMYVRDARKQPVLADSPGSRDAAPGHAGPRPPERHSHHR